MVDIKSTRKAGAKGAIRVGSLYSGIAGLELGVLAAFVEAGVPARIAWQCEIDPFCSRVLATHFPNVERFRDVATVSHPPVVDVLCGGFACQDVSAAGLGKGLGIETRSGFTLHHLLRIIDEIVPAYLVVENVASGAKRWLPRVVQELRDRGYRPRAVPLGAVDVGAPHRRLRVFVVADRDRDRCEGERGGGVLDGERAALGDDVDGRGHGSERTALADRDNTGLEVERQQQARQQPTAERGSSALPHPERLQLRDESGWRGGAESRRTGSYRAGGKGSPAQSERPSSPLAGDGRPSQSGLGSRADGVPFDVAGHRWPAGRGDDQEAWEPLRALPKEVRHFDRPAKLRALGNAVVPQCGLVVGRVLVAMMTRVEAA
jgi:DNA (cytosine-5)-methyltransferase 1